MRTALLQYGYCSSRQVGVQAQDVGFVEAIEQEDCGSVSKLDCTPWSVGGKRLQIKENRIWLCRSQESDGADWND